MAMTPRCPINHSGPEAAVRRLRLSHPASVEAIPPAGRRRGTDGSLLRQFFVSSDLLRSPARLVRLFLVVAYLVGLYTYVHVEAFGLILPPLIPGLSGAGLLMLNWRRIRLRQWLPFTVFLVVIGLGLVFEEIHRGEFMERLKGVTYLIYSIGSGYAVFLELSVWPRKRVAVFFLTMAGLIVAGCVLESYTPLRALSDGFRETVFAQGVYAEDLRDVDTAGRVRPKLFTSEPSFVALFLLLCLTVWLMAETNRRRYPLYFILSTAGLYFIRSPILVLLLVNPLLVETLWHQRHRRSPIPSVIVIATMLVTAFALAMLVLPAMGNRLTDIMYFRDASFLTRIVSPALMAMDTLRENALFGIGISGNESILIVIENALLELDVFYNLDADQLARRIVNNFWAHWIYFGLLGGSALLAAFYWAMWRLGVRHRLLCAALIAEFTQIMGGYNGVRFWSFAFLTFLVAAYPAVKSAASRPVPYFSAAKTIRKRPLRPHECVGGAS